MHSTEDAITIPNISQKNKYMNKKWKIHLNEDYYARKGHKRRHKK